MIIRIQAFLPITTVEGPGKRACICVQGCSIQCKGCAVPETWPADVGKRVKVDDMAQEILDNKRIEGVTFTGGEPFDQAEPLALLGGKMHEAGLSVVTFTGHKLEDLINAHDSSYNDLISVTDLLIDGPFIQEKEDYIKPWVGSSNQRYHFLNSRYIDLRSEFLNVPRRLEIRIQDSGVILVNGVINPPDLAYIFKDIANK